MNDKKMKPCGSEAGLEVMTSPCDQGPGVCGVAQHAGMAAPECSGCLGSWHADL